MNEQNPILSPEIKADIVYQLRRLSDHMLDIGIGMAYYGGANTEMTEKSQQLIGAAGIAKQWAGSIESKN